MVYMDSFTFAVLMMTLLKNVIKMGVDYHQSFHYVCMREYGSAEKLAEKSGQ